MKAYYTVGEFSRLFGLNVQTLRYYDSIGLFCPAYRDPKTGRRLYVFEQVYKLASIRFMRRLGYEISQIKASLDTSDIDTSLESLQDRSRQMREQWKDLLFIDNVIQRKLQFIEEKRKTIDIHSITLKTFPARYYIPIGVEENLYVHDSFYFYPTVVFYHGEEKMFGAYLGTSYDEQARNPRDARPMEVGKIPAGTCICAYHCGPYARLKETYRRASAKYPQYPHEENHISFNIIDQFVERDSDKFITEVQIPIGDVTSPNPGTTG